MGNEKDRSYVQGSKDAAEGRGNANCNLIFTPSDSEAYQKGYDYTQGQKDATEGRGNANHNLIFTPPEPEAYEKGYESVKKDEGGCFLTTAVAVRRGELDDGPTLTTLRGFRDRWMSRTSHGRELIAEYYRIAPAIVAAIPAGDTEWDRIAARVDAARDMINAGRSRAAEGIYVALVERLKRDWLSS